MRKLLALAAALALCAAPAFAQTISRSQTGAVGTVINCTDPNAATVKCVLPAVTGAVAAGTTDSGNPVKVGGVYNSTTPTLTTGQRGDLQLSPRGSLNVAIIDSTGTSGAGVTGAAGGSDAVSGAVGGLTVRAFPMVFSGSTWDRPFICGNTAVINVTAGATTQVVGLSGSTIVRVCSVAVTMSAAGTAKFVYGTGTNCGTGTTDITGAFTLATGTPLVISSGAGSIFRGAAANAVCVAAVTGNVTGVITYAQY